MLTDTEKNDKIPEDDEEYEYMEVEEGEELEDGYEYVEIDENGNEIVYEDDKDIVDESENENQSRTEMLDKKVNNIESSEGNNFDDLNPKELTNIQLEYAYLGLLFNNPKGISVYYFKHEDCFFSTEALENLYKIVIFQDGEKYAPAIAKKDFSLPSEDSQTYDLKEQLKMAVAQRRFSIEKIYTELKKLFTLKKAYLNSPTKKMQDKIIEIASYELYKDMSVEEVESAIEQITVTNKLSQSILNEGMTGFYMTRRK